MAASYSHWSLVALSVLLACAGCYVALTLSAYLDSVTPRLRQLWRVLTALTVGFTIWSMQFVGILARDFASPTPLDLRLTALSLLVAQLPTFLILKVLRRGMKSVGWPEAGVFGLSIVGTHVLLLAAVRGGAPATFFPVWLLVTAGVALALSGWAMRFLDRDWRTWQQRPRLAAATLLGTALFVVHLLGMQVVRLLPVGGTGGESDQQSVLALMVGGVATLFCVALLAALQVDRQIAVQGRRNAELRAQVMLEEARYWTVINALTEGVLMIDAQGRLLACNDSARRMFEAPDGDLATLQQLGHSHFYDAEGRHIPLEQLPGNRAIASGSVLTDVQVMLRTLRGNHKWLSMNATPLPAAAGEQSGAVVSFKDITRERDYDRKLLHQATHDELTALPNRRQFNSALVQAIDAARVREGQVGVMYLDLDHFKNVNDTLGHHVGDLLLRAITKRVRELLPPGAVPARFGGDEFGVMLPEVKGEREVWDLARTIQIALESPFYIEERELYVGVSIGFSLYPEDGEETATLLQHADLAMNEVKANGRGGLQRFSPEHARRRKREVEIERAMRSALGTEQFRLTYQPIYDLQTHKVTSCEALLRWTHPRLGAVSPAEFIPLAEESGLVDWLGEWTLRTACRQGRVWLDAGTPLTIAVNISMRQFRSGRLPELIEQVLEDAGLDPRWLMVEVTETALMSHQDDVIGQLSRLRDRGIRVALDDFGTGFSSLHLLQNLPISKLKLDRAFLRSVTTQPRQHVMVQGIVSLASALGLNVVAEGIETEEQAHALLEMGCQLGQGYLFARPQEAGDLTRQLKQGAVVTLSG